MFPGGEGPGQWSGLPFPSTQLAAAASLQWEPTGLGPADLLCVHVGWQ